MDCVERKSVTAVSAMVFMEDSERSAEIARERDIDAGLHLNLTTAFSGGKVPEKLALEQRRLIRYLRSHALARAFFHPGMTRSFEYVVAAQLDEFRRLYGHRPDRIDGHHHAHLCANVLGQKLLPEGIRVRRNFSFAPNEKNWLNRTYRKVIDSRLARRHELTDFLFALMPTEPATHHERIFALARRSMVEVETHPVVPEEYEFLIGGELFRRAADVHIRRFRS